MPTLFESYDVLLYAGNFDGSSCNHLGVARVIGATNWSAASEFAGARPCAWLVDGAPAGMVQSAGRMSWAVVFNSGHLVPLSQPAVAQEMVRRLLSGEHRASDMCS